MSKFKSLFCLVLIFCVLRSECAKAPSEYVSIETGKDSLSLILDEIGNLKDSTVLKNVKIAAKVVVHTAIAIKDIVDLINGPGESKELKFLKEQFAIVNTKIDALQHEFTDIKNQIDWKTMKVNVGEHERIIKGLEVSHANYMKAPPAIAEIFSSLFIAVYEQEYRGAAFALYKALANTGIFQENIISVARRQLKEYHVKIANLVSYILLIIQRGVVLENTYLALKGDDTAISRRKSEWAARFKELEDVAAKFDMEIRNAWSTQYRIDSHEFTTRNANLDKGNMTIKLFDFLSAKYPWRDWFVFTYTYTWDNPKDRYFDHCNGWNSGNVGNKVVIVKSRSLEEIERGRKSDPGIFLTNLKQYYKGNQEIARLLFQSKPVDCNLYYFRGVFERKSQPVYKHIRNYFYGKAVLIQRPISGSKWYYLFVLN